MREVVEENAIPVGEAGRKTPLGLPRRKWNDNITMNIKK
jgi:hypothetical protein